VTLSRVWLCVLLSLSGSGCSTASITVTELLNHGNCNALDAGVHAVTLEEVARLQGRRMIGSVSGPADKPAETQRLIAISRGEQPTAGYALELISVLTAAGDKIEVTVRWHEPAADAVVAQIITRPCLVLGLPDAATGPVSVKLEDGSPLGWLPSIQ